MSSATCDQVQLAVVQGEGLATDLREHLGGCAECRFLAELSRNLTDVGRTGAAEPSALGPAFGAALAHAVADGEPLLGRYRLEALRGRGGQGHVYRAIELETGEVVAVKLVRAGGDDTGAGEVSNARRVRHANVCRVYHTERFGEIRLIVMEYVDGPTLADRLGRLARPEALAIFHGICAGVAAAHDAGVLHLDLKPSNVLLRDGQPVVTDFGLSRRFEGDAVSAAGGTPRFMAPEQRRGDVVDRRADVYALGRILETLVPDPARRIRAAIRRATADDRDARPADARDLAQRVSPRRRRWRRWAIGVPLTVLFGLALGYVLVPPPTGPRPRWHVERWGVDQVPRDAWNVALNLRGEGLPRVDVEGRMWACSQSPWDLLDGLTQYDNWEHGVAWPPPPTREHPEWACVPLSWMAMCGPLADDDRLCDMSEGATTELIEARGRDVASLPEGVRDHLGQAVPRPPCGERAVTVVLDRPRPVFAVRSWHHGAKHVPRHFRIELRDERGELTVFETFQNSLAIESSWHIHEVGYVDGQSAPVTAQFAPVTTSAVRFVMDTCSTLTPAQLEAYRAGADPTPGHGWLNEIEVFARIPRHEAWWRELSGD